MAQDPNTTEVQSSYNVYKAPEDGKAAAPAVYANQQGNDSLARTVLVFQDAVVVMADNAGVGAHGALEILDLPAGVMAVLGATANLTLTKTSAGINATFDGDFAVGSVAADSGATLTSTEANVIPSTATPQAVAGVTTAKGGSTAAAYLDGATGAPAKLYLNILVDDADQDITATPANITVSGTLTVTYSNLGNF